MMHRTVSLASVLLVGLALAPVSAQQYAVHEPPELLPGTGTWTAVAAGDYRGAFTPGVVAVRGGQAVYLHEPGRYRSVVPIVGVGTVTGVTAFQRRAHFQGGPGSNPGTDAGTVPGDSDVLLLATTAGAKLGLYDRAAKQFGFTPVLTSAWNGATMLCSAALPATSEVLIAARSTGNTLLLARRGSTGGLTHLAQKSVGATIHEVRLVDWDNDGSVEAVAVTATGFRVFEGTLGAPEIPGMSLTINTIRSAAAKTSGIAELASVTTAATPGVFSLVQGTATSPWHSQLLPTYGLTLAQQVPTCLRAQDIEGDGTSEFLYVRTGSHQPVFVGAQGMMEVASMAPGTGDPTLNACDFLWRDLDGDDLEDGLFFWDSPLAVVFRPQLHPRLEPNGSGGSVLTLDPPPAELATVQELIVGAAYFGKLRGEEEPDLDLTISKALMGSATHLDILVWHQADPKVNPPYVQSGSVVASRIPLSAFADQPTILVQLNLRPVIEDSFFWPERDHYYLDLRFVDPALKKVYYQETDGMTIVANRSEIGTEPPFAYLHSQPTLPGRTSTSIYILDPETSAVSSSSSSGGGPPTQGTGSQIHPSLAAIGEIFTRIVLPKMSPNQVPE